MRKQLQQMEIELRELMVYQSPKELGALYTEVEEMMKQLGKEQNILIAQQMKIKAAHAARRAAWMKKVRDEAIVGVFIVVIILTVAGTFMYVAHDRQQKYPQYGNELFPKTAQQRRAGHGPVQGCHRLQGPLHHPDFQGCPRVHRQAHAGSHHPLRGRHLP